MPIGAAQANFAHKSKSFARRGKRRLGRCAMDDEKAHRWEDACARTDMRIPGTTAMRAGLPSPITTRFTTPVRTIADIEALERLPYEQLVPARNLTQLFEATARLHPDRRALTVLTPSSPQPGG